MKTWKYLWLLLIVALLVPINVSAKKKTEKVKSDRELWAGILYQMAAPVLSNMSEGKLQENMFRNLQVAWMVQTGLSQMENGKTALMNQRQEILSSLIGKATVQQTTLVS